MKPTILIIDDDPGILRMLDKRLKKLSYEVISAENGQQAFEIIENTPLDLVILDQFMPELGCVSVFRQDVR